MTAKKLTVALLSAGVAICAWMYLRDRATAVVLPPGAAAARADAGRLLDALASPQACQDRCRVDVVPARASGQWSVRLTGPSWERCFVIALSAFGHSDAHGFSGLRSVACPADEQ